MRAVWLCLLPLWLLAGCAGVLGPEADAPKNAEVAPGLPPEPLVSVVAGRPWALRMTFAAGGGTAPDSGITREARRGLIAAIVAFARGTARWAAAGVGIAQEGADSLGRGSAPASTCGDNIWGTAREAIASGRVLSIEVVGTAEDAKP